MIHLRKIEPTDVPYLYRWENDASAWADGSNHNPLSQHDLRDYVVASTGDIYRDGQLRLIIEKREPGTVNPKPITDNREPGTETLGCADLFEFDPRNRRAEIGLYIAPEYRGKGYAAQVLLQLEQYAFSFLQLRVLYAIVAVHNKPCSELFRSSHYTPSSLLPDWTLEGDAILWTKTQKAL